MSVVKNNKSLTRVSNRRVETPSFLCTAGSCIFNVRVSLS